MAITITSQPNISSCIPIIFQGKRLFVRSHHKSHLKFYWTFPWTRSIKNFSTLTGGWRRRRPSLSPTIRTRRNGRWYLTLSDGQSPCNIFPISPKVLLVVLLKGFYFFMRFPLQKKKVLETVPLYLCWWLAPKVTFNKNHAIDRAQEQWTSDLGKFNE